MKVLLYLAGIVAIILGIYEPLVWAPRSSVAVVVTILSFITGLNSFAILSKVNK